MPSFVGRFLSLVKRIVYIQAVACYLSCMSKSKAAVSLGRRRAANLTAADRSANARTGWRRRLGPDHITADQWRVLAHLRGGATATASVKVGGGAAGDRFWDAAIDLGNRHVIVINDSEGNVLIYQRGPAWVDQKHIRVASKKSE
jgi:hypothetical protein